jgi:hypothetical protein
VKRSCMILRSTPEAHSWSSGGQWNTEERCALTQLFEVSWEEPKAEEPKAEEPKTNFAN